MDIFADLGHVHRRRLHASMHIGVFFASCLICRCNRTLLKNQGFFLWFVFVLCAWTGISEKWFVERELLVDKGLAACFGCFEFPCRATKRTCSHSRRLFVVVAVFLAPFIVFHEGIS